MDLNDIRCFINGLKEAFYIKEKEIDNNMRYSMIKRVVDLRIKETKLMKKSELNNE